MFLLDIVSSPHINSEKALAAVALSVLVVLLIRLWKKK